MFVPVATACVNQLTPVGSLLRELKPADASSTFDDATNLGAGSMKSRLEHALHPNPVGHPTATGEPRVTNPAK